MNMKRYIIYIVAAMVCIGCLAACGNSADNGEGTPSPQATDAGSASPAATGTDAASPSAGSAGTVGEGDWAYIENKGTMVIGITYFEPMNYLDDQGKLTGFETEFAEVVCEKLGVQPEFQEINWSSKEIELSAKKIDCIWNGMTIDDERKANMSISQPYMQNTQVLIAKAENAEALAASVDGKNIVAEAGSAGETVTTGEDFFANANFTPVDTQAKALMEVAAGTADGCVVDYVLSIGMIGDGTDFANLVLVEGRSFGDEEYGIAFRKEDTETTKKINDAIAELIESGELQTIADKYKLGDRLITD